MCKVLRIVTGHNRFTRTYDQMIRCRNDKHKAQNKKEQETTRDTDFNVETRDGKNHGGLQTPRTNSLEEKEYNQKS